MEPSNQRENDGVLMAATSDLAGAASAPGAPIFAHGDVVSDRYHVIRFIARGGMGEVYEVEDTELRTRVALKTIAPERASSARQVARFRQEIQLARRVSHPNVCRVFDLGRHKDGRNGDVLFLTMELLPGQTLARCLHDQGPMSGEQALPLIRQMVSALAAAHQLGIVHRDFKPGNVMLEQTPQGAAVKVTDFGLATSPELNETRSSSLSEVVGTPEYMAPEQLRGQSSNRTDIYALGMSVFQMLTGKLPASHTTPFKAPETGTGKRIPTRWREAITKSIASDPGDRYASVQEFWSALSGETLPGQTFWHRMVNSVRRHRAAYGIAACLVVVATALLAAGVVPNPFRPLPREKHIAVLPFDNIGNDASNQAFAEGVAESLTSKLSQLERYQKSFWVVPSSDARNVKSLDEAYRDLNVTLAVMGSIEHTPHGVNLTADLVDPKNHRQLASRSFHVESANLDDLQQRVWESVADMLDLQISRQAKDELAAGGTTKAGAYELYEEGNGYLQRYDLDDVDHAIDLFNKAVAKDPQYALAYAGLGTAYATKYSLTKDPQWIADATRNAGMGVQLNGRLIPVRVALARVYQLTGQIDKALVEYQSAMETDPGAIFAAYQIGRIYAQQGKFAQAEAAYKNLIRRRPDYWIGYNGLGELYYNNGKFTEAAQQFQMAINVAPINPQGYFNLGGTYIGLGRYQDAISILQKGLSIKTNSSAWTNLGSAYMYMGKFEEAADAMKHAADLSPHDHVMWRNLGDSYHQIPSRAAEARQAYEKALETATAQLKVNPNDPEVLSGIALYDAHLGNALDAETFIRRALAANPNNSDTLFTSALVYEIIGHREKALESLDLAAKAGYSLDEIAQEPELRSLQADPRYQRWLQQMKGKK